MAQSLVWSAILVAGLTTLGGCGEVAFKRGSGADALAADHASCCAKNSDAGAVRACLSQKGWHVADLGPDAAPAAAAPSVAPAPLPAASLPKAPPAPIVPVTQSAAPGGKISVGSWFKFGGGSGELNDAIAACVAVLGPANQPAAGYHLVTAALYKCLGTHGWHGLGHGA
jgi:hypothetical protein